ncbi:uncharacterized protein CIMG_04053 [Coccidioides immitis RS]|uniref:Uncharacterized protein n=4 Tax=Coccidioides immitis TaxID=5501 RepID=J3KCP1_COCIM|nr:uncharacterized protein CIMG_04053 [Coccidioides immitis RS]EAS33029.3 hypothetical protein CIMG_04053 [Coccidioides immitis RS]KMP08311.1 hypothetical protein CIRG_07992 [Coccidioides immitis RMSCC 2394]KMU72431.1 hypothetical protein CISG_03079 [Coccidioides immitis RMSCC 3703]KMU88638.1 hypothetical protein CIHG_06577 [Coccidioides immitis H538.4]
MAPVVGSEKSRPKLWAPCKQGAWSGRGEEGDGIRVFARNTLDLDTGKEHTNRSPQCPLHDVLRSGTIANGAEVPSR